MKTASQNLINFLNSPTNANFLMADLYTVTLKNGLILYYTGCDRDIVYSGITYSSALPIERSAVRLIIGLEVDTLKITVYPTDANLIGGITFLQGLRTGTFDAGALKLDRLFLSDWSTPVGTVNLFTGRIADVSISRTEAEINVKSDLELLNIEMPRNVYQPGCIWTLFDSGCGLTASNFGVSEVVGAGSTNSFLHTSPVDTTDYFSGGKIWMTSGANSGLYRTVKSYTGVAGASSGFTLMYPLPSIPTVGDTFTAYFSCDKTQSICTGRFNNLVNYRGYPYIPVPETAV